MQRPPLLLITAALSAIALATGPSGASAAPRPSLDTPGQCEAGIELSSAPRFFCNLISFEKPAGWQLEPSNTMLVATPGGSASGSSFTVTTGNGTYASFASFAAAETPVARQLVEAGGSPISVQTVQLPAGMALEVASHVADGSTHDVVAFLFRKTPYVISAIGASAVDLADIYQMISSTDFAHPAGVAKHLMIAMDWKQMVSADGRRVGSVSASNLELGNRHWSVQMTISNLATVPLRVSGMALLRYVPTYLANPAGYTSISVGSHLMPRPAGFDRGDDAFLLPAGKTWSGVVSGIENIAVPDEFVRLGTAFTFARGAKPAEVEAAAYGPLLGAPAAV